MSSRKYQLLALIVSLLSINLASANDIDVENLVKNAKEKQLGKKLANPQNQVLTRGHFDSRLSAKVFNWNNGNIKNIPLDASKSGKTQYLSSLDNYFKQVASNHGASKMSVDGSQMERLHDTGRGAIIAQYKQKVDGVEVFGRSINIMVNRKNEFIASSGYFSLAKTKPSDSYQLNSSQALAKAFFANTGVNLDADSLSISIENKSFSSVTQKIGSGDVFLTKNSRVKKVYFPLGNEQLVAAFYVEAETVKKGEKTSKWFSYVIDGQTGKVLFSNNLTSHVSTTYKVFADTNGDLIPFDGPQGNQLTPHPTGDVADTPAVGETFVMENTVTLDHAGLSTNDPWLTDTQTTTSGNNVDAYADISGEDGFDDVDVRPGTTAPNAFEYDFGAFSDGLSGDPQKHAVVSLFYINNFLHDWFYDNGFDEAAGNAQVSNFGRGGEEGDHLRVEAQDFSGENNANMSTPADGSSPRMQMFLWTFLSDASVTVAGVNNIETLAAAFGPEEYDVTGVMSLVDDGTDPIGDGCETITIDLTGLIAIIDRGTCNFTVKVKNAQDVGAVGVIMVNNVTGGVIVQGGEDATVTIPSMMVSLEKGDEIKAALAADDTLQVTLFNQAKPIDGTLDNGIVAHEWGHYLSNRLVGNANGLSNNQGRSMGEGWSDFLALLMTVKESDNLITGNENFQGVYSASTFVGNAYYGIRRAPFSTDMNKNALTFKHIEDGVGLTVSHPIAFGASGASNSEVHASGEIWANALWEAYVGLLNKPSYTFAQAQQTMKDYLVASLKLTPNDPTMLEARDALLAVAIANNAEDFEIIRAAFTKRGMGAGAVAPDRASDGHSGVVEDFTAGVDMIYSLELDQSSLTGNSCDNDGVFDTGETASFTLTFNSFAATSIPAFEVNLSSTDDVTFDNSMVNIGTISNFGQTTTATVEMTLNSATAMQDIDLTATVAEIGTGVDDFVEPSPITINLTGHFDFEATQFSDNMSVERASTNDWSLTRQANTSPSFFVVDGGAWYGADSGVFGSSELVTPTIRTASSGDVVIEFDHFYFFESSDDNQGIFTHWDAGVIEVSVDGGAFVDVVDFGATLLEPYNGTVSDLVEILGGRNAYTFTRDINSTALSSNSITFPDGLVNGQNIRVRFRIGTDTNTGDFGWLIDNVVVTNAIDPMFSEIVAENNACVSTNAPTVDAGGDIVVIFKGQTDVDINLSGSTDDLDGDTLTVQWIQRSGPTVTINNADSNNASFNIARPTIDTILTFELRADDGTQTTTDLLQVDIRLNQAPTVSATGGSVEEGKSFTLNATGNDNEGDDLTYTWTQTAGPTVTLSNPTSQTPSFTAPQVNATTTLTFTVVANDGDLDSIASSTNVSVTNRVEQSAGGGGGGGSLPIYCLVLLGLARGFVRKSN